LRNGFQFGGGTGTHGAVPAEESSFAHWADHLKAAISHEASLVGKLLKG
jgi:hypothetical protein